MTDKCQCLTHRDCARVAPLVVDINTTGGGRDVFLVCSECAREWYDWIAENRGDGRLRAGGIHWAYDGQGHERVWPWYAWNTGDWQPPIET